MNRMNVGRARVLRPEKHQSLASAMLDINSIGEGPDAKTLGMSLKV
jgi:hypothetical protein